MLDGSWVYRFEAIAGSRWELTSRTDPVEFLEVHSDVFLIDTKGRRTITVTRGPARSDLSAWHRTRVGAESARGIPPGFTLGVRIRIQLVHDVEGDEQARVEPDLQRFET